MAGTWTSFDLALLLALSVLVALLYWRQANERDPEADGDEEEGGAPVGRDPLAGSMEGLEALELRPHSYTWRLLRQSGLEPESWRPWFYLTKVVLALALSLSLAFWLARNGHDLRWPVPLLAIVGFFVPDALLMMRRRARRRRIAFGLTHFLDLLVSLLQAGLSLDQAFSRAARAGFARRHPLSREIEHVSVELDAGEDPCMVFRSLAERTGVTAMLGIAAALRLATRKGISVRFTFETQADLLWSRHREDVRRQIQTASVASVFAVLLCGMPAFAVLSFVPVSLVLAQVLRDLVGF